MKHNILRLIIIEMMIVSISPFTNVAITTTDTVDQTLPVIPKDEENRIDNFPIQTMNEIIDSSNLQENNSRNTEQQINSVIKHELPAGATADQFITKWDTRLQPSNQITLPLTGTGNNDFVVDWGDGTNGIITPYDYSNKSHTYDVAGAYTVTITGTLDGWAFRDSDNSKQLVDVMQWGNMKLGNAGSNFRDAINMVISATDVPDLSGTTNMNYLFANCYQLNQPLNFWNVSTVTTMNYMFYNATSFNQPLNYWDTSSVTKMRGMFYEALNFNQSINDWDVSAVTDMIEMFYKAKNFNQPLNDWDTSSVTDMSDMFYHLEYFNQPLSNWDTSSVYSMKDMFNGAMKFNQPLNTWNVSRVNVIKGMFREAIEFNQPLDNWNTRFVNDMREVFYKTIKFNQPINTWDTSGVWSMAFMFYYAESFNRPLSNWNTFRVDDMSYMFYKATSFNRPLNTWNTGHVRDMKWMFRGAVKFNQPLDNWNVSSVKNMKGMLDTLTLPVDYYDNMLITWSSLTLHDSVAFSAGSSKYSSIAADARKILSDTYNWEITDGGLDENYNKNITSSNSSNISDETSNTVYNNASSEMSSQSITILRIPLLFLSTISTMIVISLILRKQKYKL